MSSVGKAIKVSREDLYQQVWAEPITKLAPKYGLSDVGLAKVCRKHDIPRPPVGYWAKAGVGKHVEQTPLPELDDESLEEIEFFRQHFFGDDSGTLATAKEKISVEVPERLASPHPLVVQTKNLLAANRTADVASDSKAAPCLNVQVSSNSVSRALRILDTLIKKWEELGGAVRIDQSRKEEDRTRFTYGDDSVAVMITEEWQTGRLAIQIHGRWCDGLRKRWADGKQQLLENVLGSFIEGLQKWIEHERDSRLDDAIQDRQRKQVAAKRQQREQLAKEIGQRRDNLEQCAENFAKSETIRRYLATFEAKIANGEIRPSNPEAFPEWLTWAKWYADMLDPLTPTPKREEYQILSSNTPASSLELTRRGRQLVKALGVEDTDALYRVDYRAASAAMDGNIYGPWSEIGCVLEGLGYDVSGRRSY